MINNIATCMGNIISYKYVHWNHCIFNPILIIYGCYDWRENKIFTIWKHKIGAHALFLLTAKHTVRILQSGNILSVNIVCIFFPELPLACSSFCFLAMSCWKLYFRLGSVGILVSGRCLTGKSCYFSLYVVGHLEWCRIFHENKLEVFNTHRKNDIMTIFIVSVVTTHGLAPSTVNTVSTMFGLPVYTRPLADLCRNIHS